MVLSSELLSQFAKITKDEKPAKKETTVYGTIAKHEDRTYVKIDGSDLLTPIVTTTEAEVGDRVSILLKDHTATVTGNITSPSVRTETVRVIVDSVTGMETVLADTVSTEQLNALEADIRGTLTAQSAIIDVIEADNVEINEKLTAQEGYISSLQTDNLDIHGKLTAIEADILELTVGGQITAETLKATFANIDFSNVSKATMASFYANSGLIENVTVGDATISGRLVGVTINGDLIEGGTVIADKLVIKGEDGLYYKLNTDGVKTEAEQTDYNSLNGEIITAKSITASKITVSDLVAFGATIGGFKITESALYSGVKESADNNTRGVYLDSNGQLAVGDASNYIKYYDDGDGYKLGIRADSIVVGVNQVNVESAISAAAKGATDYMALSSAGLVVGQRPSNPIAGNTLISSDGVSIRKGTSLLAGFKAASRTTSDISSASLTSEDLMDSESDGVTNVSGTVARGETRSNVYIWTDGNPVYFNNGIETDKVLINNKSGIISNANLLLNGTLVDKNGSGILTPVNSYGNTVIGYARYAKGGNTHVYGTRVKMKTKDGFSVSVDGNAAIETNNDNGNSTFGWHHYETNKGETNIYGKIVSLYSKDDIRINPEGNFARINGSLVPYEANTYNLGAATLPFKNVYIGGQNDGSYRGIRFANSAGNTYNAVGINESGYQVFGNTTYCTNIVTKSTTTGDTGYSFKITCGDNPDLAIGDNDARLLLFGGTDSTSRYLGSMAAYKRTYSGASNLLITENGIIGRSTSSSRRYKKDISDLPFDVVSGLYNLPVRQFKYLDECLSQDDIRYGIDIPGFIAEEVAEYLPIACDYILDSDGNRVPEMWNSKIIIPALLKLIQDLNGRIQKLEGVG